MSTPFHTSRLVEFSDTDMAGIAHFTAFFRYMEAAEHELLRSLSLSVYSEIDGTPVSFPRVAASCQFHAPARCEDVLDIDVSGDPPDNEPNVGTKSVTYGFEFRDQGRHVASGEMTSVCCRIAHGAPPEAIEIPDDVVEKLQGLAD